MRVSEGTLPLARLGDVFLPAKPRDEQFPARDREQSVAAINPWPLLVEGSHSPTADSISCAGLDRKGVGDVC